MSIHIKFLVDESTGASVAEYLRRAGFDVLFVGETMQQADDADILTQAVHENRILMTNDKDFGELVFRSGRPHAGVVLFRLQDESQDNRVRIAQIVVEEYLKRLPDNFVVVTEKGLRVRRRAKPS
jgi:predicted nuclease of predicted toxin-antitoxin system